MDRSGFSNIKKYGKDHKELVKNAIKTWEKSKAQWEEYVRTNTSVSVLAAFKMFQIPEFEITEQIDIIPEGVKVYMKPLINIHGSWEEKFQEPSVKLDFIIDREYFSKKEQSLFDFKKLDSIGGCNDICGRNLLEGDIIAYMISGTNQLTLGKIYSIDKKSKQPIVVNSEFGRENRIDGRRACLVKREDQIVS